MTGGNEAEHVAVWPVGCTRSGQVVWPVVSKNSWVQGLLQDVEILARTETVGQVRTVVNRRYNDVVKLFSKSFEFS